MTRNHPSGPLPEAMPAPIANALVTIESWKGCTVYDTNAARASEWAHTLLPNDPPAQALYYLKQGKSTCALVAKAYLRLLGCTCKEHGPYLPRDGMAVADIETIGRRHKAWLTSVSSLQTYPEPGDVITVGPNPNWHVLVVTGSLPATADVESMDGGQGLHGANTLPRRRQMIVPGSESILVDVADGVSNNVGYRRPMYGRLDAEALVSTLHLCK